MRVHRSAYYRMAVSRSIPPRRVVGTSKGAPLPAHGRGLDGQAATEAQQPKGERPSQSKSKAEGTPPNKEMSVLTLGRRSNTGAASLLVPLCRLACRFPGPQEHRTPEKAHPGGDPDLFPGALDRPLTHGLPCDATLELDIASLFSGAIQAHPARPQTHHQHRNRASHRQHPLFTRGQNTL
jgi:hypothetical protein